MGMEIHGFPLAAAVVQRGGAEPIVVVHVMIGGEGVGSNFLDKYHRPM